MDWKWLIGLVVGSAGFILTLWQVVEAKRAARGAQTAAEATRAATVAAQDAIGANLMLIMLVPALHRIETTLSHAHRDRDPKRFADALLQWRDQANLMMGMLARDGEGKDTVIRSLGATLAQVGPLKGQLIEGKADMDHEDVGAMMRSIDTAMSELQLMLPEGIVGSKERASG